jgi:hypothetical protein
MHYHSSVTLTSQQQGRVLAQRLFPLAFVLFALGVLPQAAPAADSIPESANGLAPNSHFDSTEQPASRSASEYQMHIESLEGEHGPYHNQLSEHLVGLGIAQQNNGDHENAIDTFSRAMHVNRINSGLYSLSQVPILERLIESHIAQGQWEDASNSHEYLYWLHRRNFGENDPRMLPAIEKMSKWHLQAYSLNVGSGLFHHLINAHNLYSLAVNIIDHFDGEDEEHEERLINALRGITVSNYYLATFQASSLSRSNQQMIGEKPTQDDQIRLEQYIMNSYSSGKKAIKRIHDVYASNPDAYPTGAVEAQVELADWHLLFNRWHTAMDMYQQAYDNLAQNPETESKAKELFSKPVALPDMPLLNTKVDNSNLNNEYVLVNFDVSANGRARNIEIVESNPPENVRNRSKVRKSLKYAKFRPRFEGGVPVITQNLTHRYVFPPKGH